MVSAGNSVQSIASRELRKKKERGNKPVEKEVEEIPLSAYAQLAQFEPKRWCPSIGEQINSS